MWRCITIAGETTYHSVIGIATIFTLEYEQKKWLFYKSLLPLIALSIWNWKAPNRILFLVVLFVNARAYTLYVFDKEYAEREGSRIPESRLALMSFLGGWVGAYIAQQALPHKVSDEKAAFRNEFWLTVYLWQFYSIIMIFALLDVPFFSDLIEQYALWVFLLPLAIVIVFGSLPRKWSLEDKYED